METTPRENNSTESVSSIEALDLRWYARFEELGSFETEEYLTGDKSYRESQKEAFLNNEIANPVFDYPKIDLDDISRREEGLVILKQEILESEPNELVKQVYRWKINEKIASARLLKAAKTGDVRRFERYNNFVFGEPSKEIYNYTVNSLLQKAQAVLESDESSKHLKAAAQDVVDSFTPQPTVSLYRLPTEETFTMAKEASLEEVGSLVELEPFEGKIDAEAMKVIFEESLRRLGASEDQGGDWRVVIDSSSSTAVSLSAELKAVKIPESRTIEYKKLAGLIAHEVGTHLARRVNGNRSKLMLLGLGLDRYIMGEEGVATMREQVVQKDALDEFAGLHYHLGISLARGLDGQKRNFAQTHEMLVKVRYLNKLLEQAKTGEEKPNTALSFARKNGYNDCVRIFRGADCSVPGAVFSKDLAYRTGNMNVFRLIETTEGKSEMVRFSIGKYDPANPRHIWILDQLGITEEDLNSVEAQSVSLDLT